MSGMVTLGHIATTSLLLITFIRVCDGIICFNCHSTTTSGCGDNFRIQTSDVDSRFECDGTCYKRRGKRTSGNGEVRRVEVQRGCMTIREDGCFTETFNGMKQYTCVCNTNFCNNSPVSHVSIYLLLFCFISTLFSFKFKSH